MTGKVSPIVPRFGCAFSLAPVLFSFTPTSCSPVADGRVPCELQQALDVPDQCRSEGYQVLLGPDECGGALPPVCLYADGQVLDSCVFRDCQQGVLSNRGEMTGKSPGLDFILYYRYSLNE